MASLVSFSYMMYEYYVVHADVYISCTPYDRTLYILATVSN